MNKKVQEWEYDDVMHDYLQWKNELDRLLKEEEPDEEAIKETEEIIEKYEGFLFNVEEPEY